MPTRTRRARCESFLPDAPCPPLGALCAHYTPRSCAGAQAGKTPLILAAAWGSDAVAKLLLEHGADPNGQDPVRSECSLCTGWEHRLWRCGAVWPGSNQADAAAQEKWTPPLLIVARDGREAMAKLLLEKGADEDVQSEVSRPSVEAETLWEPPFLRSSPDQLSLCERQKGNTPLILASANGKKAVVKLLLAAGADADVRNEVRGSWAENGPCHVKPPARLGGGGRV